MLELAYFALLAAVYTRADLSFAYPIARGSAPVLVLLISVIALGAHVSLVAAAGVLAVTGGVLLVRGVGRQAGDLGSLALALGVGACIAGYTLVDDHGIRHAGALPYFEVILVACAIPYAAVDRRPQRRNEPSAPPRTATRLLAGVGMVTAYLLVLAALERAEAAPVAALRETSVVMAAAGAALARQREGPGRQARRRVPRHGRRRRRRPGVGDRSFRFALGYLATHGRFADPSPPKPRLRARPFNRGLGFEALDEAPAAAFAGEGDGPGGRGSGDEVARGGAEARGGRRLGRGRGGRRRRRPRSRGP